MARPRNQGARREALKRAALKALAERGVHGTRLKDVAEHAGLTPASVLYYYPELDDLLYEALRQAMERFYDRRRKTVEGIPDARERLVATVRGGMPSGPGDDEVRLAWEALPFELRNERLSEFDRLYVERQIDLYASILELGVAQGHFSVSGAIRSVAANLIALEDYHGLRVLLGWVAPPEEAAALVLDYASLATGCELDVKARL